MTLKLQGSTSGHTAIDAHATAGSNTLVLPQNNGSAGQVLQTDGNGNLTWVDHYDTQNVHRNLLHNGEMRVDQRYNGSAKSVDSSSGNPTYETVDRWFFMNFSSEAFRCNSQRVSDVPSNQGFQTSVKIDTTTAQGTPSGNNYSSLAQFIESRDCIHLNHGNANASTLTLSFWIKSTKTGTSSVYLAREDATRGYTAEYTISSSNTWEKKTITIPGDTSGAPPNNDNGRGFTLLFPFFAGSSRHTAVNAWNAWPGGWYGASANQTNLVDNTSNNIFITGVQLEIGSNASDFERLSYGIELARCQRYYEEGAFSFRNSGSIVRYFQSFNTTKIKNPTVNVYYDSSKPTAGTINSGNATNSGWSPNGMMSGWNIEKNTGSNTDSTDYAGWYTASSDL